MSKHVVTKRKTIRDIAAMKGGESAIVCLTAYTAPVARLADAHADLVLVGDSLGNVIYGFDSTLPVTMDIMVAHGRAVVNATAAALVVVDMPFGSYQESPEQAFRNAARLMAEAGCQAVKFEGGEEMAETAAFLVRRGIPVMGHIGLQPQSVHGAGGYHVTGRKDEEQKKLLADAKALADAGAFSIVLECMDADLAAAVTAAVPVPDRSASAPALPATGRFWSAMTCSACRPALSPDSSNATAKSRKTSMRRSANMPPRSGKGSSRPKNTPIRIKKSCGLWINIAPPRRFGYITI